MITGTFIEITLCGISYGVWYLTYYNILRIHALTVMKFITN